MCGYGSLDGVLMSSIPTMWQESDGSVSLWHNMVLQYTGLLPLGEVLYMQNHQLFECSCIGLKEISAIFWQFQPSFGMFSKEYVVVTELKNLASTLLITLVTSVRNKSH